MSMKKILFSGDQGSANISGLIESLKKTSPATLAALRDGGGRINGEKQVAEYPHSTSPNASNILQQKKL
jgi:hypothetical protein